MTTPADMVKKTSKELREIWFYAKMERSIKLQNGNDDHWLTSLELLEVETIAIEVVADAVRSETAKEIDNFKFELSNIRSLYNAQSDHINQLLASETALNKEIAELRWVSDANAILAVSRETEIKHMKDEVEIFKQERNRAAKWKPERDALDKENRRMMDNLEIKNHVEKQIVQKVIALKEENRRLREAINGVLEVARDHYDYAFEPIEFERHPKIKPAKEALSKKDGE